MILHVAACACSYEVMDAMPLGIFRVLTRWKTLPSVHGSHPCRCCGLSCGAMGKKQHWSGSFATTNQLKVKQDYINVLGHMATCLPNGIRQEVKRKLSFWQKQISYINGREIWHSPSAVRVVYSDASDTGYGGFTAEHGCYAARGDRSAEERTKRSIWRKLRAVRMVLESLIPKLLRIF